MSVKPYIRLPGIGRSWVAVHGAWAGDTHLLCVESYDFMERYRRFYYAEIQAIVLEPTRHRLVTNLVAGGGGGLLALMLGLLFTAEGDARAGWIASAVVAAIFGGAVLVNTLLGPGVKLTIVTAVQAYTLPGIRRRRTALKFIDRVQPRILYAQSAPAASAPPAPGSPPPA